MEREYFYTQGYHTQGTVKDTEVAIKLVKDYFERTLSVALNLTRVTAPLFVSACSGMNDNLNGTERPVLFDAKDLDSDVEIVHSLAKWKRAALADYGFVEGEGLYTDMNAIRRDEDLDHLHSIYVDQWDYELIINPQHRNLLTLKDTVRKIYAVMQDTERYIHYKYPDILPVLPSEMYFITSQELEDMYPDLSPSDREKMIVEDKKAVFLMQIGCKLASGQAHDGRAADYDDWSLNGDILVYHPTIGGAMELSSMGIRVDERALVYQLEQRGAQSRVSLPYHRRLLAGEFPQTLGGGIGQSRLCMFFLRKMHVGEVQSSLWSESMREFYDSRGVRLL